MPNLTAPAPSMTEDWSPSDLVIAKYMERVLSNLQAQLKNDNPSDVILSSFFIGLMLGSDPRVSEDVGRAMWRMTEDAFGKPQTDLIRGATGGLLIEIRKAIRYGRM